MDEQFAAFPQHWHTDAFTVILTLLISLFQNNRLSDKMDRLSQRIDRFAEQHHKDILILMSEIVRLNDRVAKMER